ncbi:MAG: AAA family ATPase, partial [Waterburya sp.]
MATSAKHLLIASTEAYSGKTATILGLSYLSLERDISIGYGQPLATNLSQNDNDTQQTEDSNFIATTLELTSQQAKSPFLFLNRQTINQR